MTAERAPALLRLDHIVIAVGDLAQTCTDFRALGFTVLAGGEHAGRPSHNALVVLADGAYLELIAWRAPAPQERWYRDHAAHGDGLVDFALLPHDTGAVLAAARQRGLASLSGPFDGRRLRPDGEQLKWQTARHDTPDLPFLCGDITPRSLRVPEGDARRHGNGASGVASLVVAVHDIEASLARYRALLGDDAVIGAARADGASGCLSADIELGGCRLQLRTPDPSVTAETSAAAALRQRLATRGQGPCALVLRGQPGASAQAFDTALCHGVALQLAPAGHQDAVRGLT
ncbi:MAG: VOC family protein [Rubrivivax sp.]|nr:VOC family protein [Rubrivivax sp.]MDP3085932.1 VOC family protein [Rubrivivax sp.]